MKELAELKARHAELDQEISEAWGVYTEIRDRANREKSQIDREMAAIKKNRPGNEAIASALKSSFELRMKRHEEQEAMKQKLMPSRLDQDIAAENVKKRRVRNAEAVAQARIKRAEKS